MPIAITIRDVPEAVRDELAARARRSGRSLQEHLRLALIDLSQRPDPVDLVAEVRARKYATGSVLPAERILEHLHAERR
ncbi:MAG: hypothetical protein RLZZ272_647 [Actinomycetota bacterium]|jgi:plasmid stability protein